MRLFRFESIAVDAIASKHELHIIGAVVQFAFRGRPRWPNATRRGYLLHVSGVAEGRYIYLAGARLIRFVGDPLSIRRNMRKSLGKGRSEKRLRPSSIESESMRWPYMVSSWTTPIRQLLLVTDSQERRLGWRGRAVQPRCLPKLEMHRARRLAWRKEACVGSTFELSCFPRCVAPVK